MHHLVQLTSRKPSIFIYLFPSFFGWKTAQVKDMAAMNTLPQHEKKVSEQLVVSPLTGNKSYLGILL